MTMARKPVEETITIAVIEAFLQKAAQCVQELLRAASQLPKIDENGSSECPFAEELYAKKEEAQKKARLGTYSKTHAVSGHVDRIHALIRR